jgi:hypothetical protein
MPRMRRGEREHDFVTRIAEGKQQKDEDETWAEEADISSRKSRAPNTMASMNTATGELRR